MLFFKLSQVAFGDEPEVAYGQFLDELIAKNTFNVFEAFQQCNVVVRQDNVDYKLDDEITRYADLNVVVYGFEEKIHPDYFYVAIKYSSLEGHNQMISLMRDIQAHPSYLEVDNTLQLVGVISDEPQCIPCIKRKMEQRASLPTISQKTSTNSLKEEENELEQVN